MSSLDDLKNLSSPPPSGWNPGVMWDGEAGYVTTPLRAEEPTPDEVNEILRTSRLDPEKIIVDWTQKARITSQINGDGELVQCWYKLPIVAKPDRTFDVEDLLDVIHDDIDPPEYVESLWRTIQIGDTHIGKGALDGGGTDVIVQRWKDSVNRALDCDYREGIHLAFLGDLIEGQVSQGGANIAGCDMTLTEQLRVARHMVAWTVNQALDVGQRVIVTAVPGNHGGTTRQQNMPVHDSYDVDIINSVQLAFDMTEQADRIDWFYPEPGTGHITYKVGDTVFTSVHGHRFRGKLSGAEEWWSGMTVNGRAPGAAQIMLAGHFHSMQVSNFTADRWIMFGPSLETQSTWFAESTGASSKPGVLVFDTADGEPMDIGVM